MDAAQKYHYKDLAKLFCKNDVLVVTIEYRLGYLGYFCLDNKYAKGNYGLWDQVFALRFVHDNIRLFGGDPDLVTVFGQVLIVFANIQYFLEYYEILYTCFQ